MVALSPAPDLPVGFPSDWSGPSPVTTTHRAALVVPGFPSSFSGEARVVIAVVREPCHAHFRRSRGIFLLTGLSTDFPTCAQVPWGCSPFIHTDVHRKWHRDPGPRWRHEPEPVDWRAMNAVTAPRIATAVASIIIIR